MRQVINKLITEEDLYAAVDAAYSQGWRRMKLYFLTGLPTETDEDTLGIAELAKQVVEIGRQYNKQASCTVSVGGFVPKPHTPFQWFGQNSVDELRRKIGLLRDACKGTRAQLKWHDPAATFAEGIASRGDRRIGRVIERVWRAGGTFQEWSEHFDLDRWIDAMAAEGLDPDWYVTRHRTRDEVLPWDHIAAGLHKDFLWDDWQAALHAYGLPDCRWTPCYDCGVCTDYALEHVVASPVAPAGGSRRAPARACARRRRVAGAVPGHQTQDGRSSVREGRRGVPGPPPLHEARQGPLDLAPRRRPRVRARVPYRAAPARVHRGVLPRPKVSFGLALSTGLRERRRVPRPRVQFRRRPRQAARRAVTDALPVGIDVVGAAPLVERAPALMDAVTSVEWHVVVQHDDGTPARTGHARVRRRPRARATGVADDPPPQRSRGRRRRPAGDRSARRARRHRRPGRRRACTMELHTQPRSAKPGDVLAAIASAAAVPGGLAEAHVLRTHQWIERDGARLEPLRADTRPRAVRAGSRPEQRPSRCPTST